jgi:hypothetical protein
MNKLKMSALTATAAALVGSGALAAAPSAPAMPTLRAALCAEIADEMNHHVQQRDELERVFGPTFWLTVYYNNLVNEDYDLYRDMC